MDQRKEKQHGTPQVNGNPHVGHVHTFHVPFDAAGAQAQAFAHHGHHTPQDANMPGTGGSAVHIPFDIGQGIDVAATILDGAPAVVVGENVVGILDHITGGGVSQVVNTVTDGGLSV